MRAATKKSNRTLVLIICLVAMMCVTMFSTLAYLTDRESVTNTFTVGDVNITVDEAKVNTDGTPVVGADRVIENKYHLIPGQTYTKDPTMTVLKNSEESYVRMIVKINCLKELDKIFDPYAGSVITSIFGGYDGATWVYKTETRDTVNNTITYEFRYKETVKNSDADNTLKPLFESITLPGAITKEQLETIKDLQIVVEGHAIQKVGFDNADAAWAAFDAQYAQTNQ